MIINFGQNKRYFFEQTFDSFIPIKALLS